MTKILISIMTSLTKHGLKTIYDTILRVEQVKAGGVKSLGDLFAENPRLIISPSNYCNSSCLHCVADSVPTGEMMPYKKFAWIDPSFIKIFSFADFGRRGNPLLYNSEGHDLADLMTFLNDHGINSFTIAASIQKNYAPIIGRLEDFASKRKADIETMVTYHHYLKDLDAT